MQASNLLPDINATGQQVDKCRHRCSRRCAFEDARVALKTAASSTIACVMFRMLYYRTPFSQIRMLACTSLPCTGRCGRAAAWPLSIMLEEHIGIEHAL